MPPPPAPPGFTEYQQYIEFQHSDEEDEDELAGALLLGNGEQHERPQGLRGVFASLWKEAHDVQSARANHTFSSEEKRKLNNFESIDYLAPNSIVYRKWLSRQPHRRYWDRWLMMGGIGLTTGLVAHMLYASIDTLAHIKFSVTRRLILHANIGVAWLFNTVYSLALVAGSSALIVGLAPAAVGSGVPEVMAYLNGVLMPKVFNIFTVAVKFLSCALAVASGLPIGPEGPMVHIGAALGAALSQGHSTTLGFSTKIFRRFRNPKDKRDFVTAGVAVGVATAFNAPIGGLLFAFEEVASFWQQSLGWQIFFACMCATLTLNLSRSAGKALFHSGSFGWFNQDVVFEAGVEISAHILAVVPAAVVGLAAGLLGIAFTVLNLKMARLRDALTAGTKWRRMIEPCVLVVLYTTGSMVLPLFFPCSATHCITHKGQVYCGDFNTTMGNSTYTDADLANMPASLPLYTCSVRTPETNRTWVPDSGTITPDTPTNATAIVYYNELATLLFATGEHGIKHLLHRGSHHLFSYPTLVVLLAWYFLGATFAAGSAVASGLFVPMLMIGACIGRIVGLATTDVAAYFGQHLAGAGTGIDSASNPWSWIDPGAFALVGAGAFMSSVTRLTVALAVICVEISDDVHMLLPVLVAIMVAKWVADAATHSLYHALLEVKCVPFLYPEPVSRHSLDLVPVSAVMRSPVVTLRTSMKLRDIQEALRDTPHNGFPVVRDTSSGQVFLGLISRGHLVALLQRIIAADPDGGRAAARSGLGPAIIKFELQWTELNRKMMDPVEEQHAAAPEQQMVALHNAADWEVDLSSGLLDVLVDLTPYINTSAFKVQDTFSIERAYILFRSMGLRHMVVVDAHNRVKGIMTRKDLLGFRLDEALNKALQRVESARELGHADWLLAARDASSPSRPQSRLSNAASVWR